MVEHCHITPDPEAQTYPIKPISPRLRGAFVVMLLVFDGLPSLRLLVAQAEKRPLGAEARLRLFSYITVRPPTVILREMRRLPVFTTNCIGS